MIHVEAFSKEYEKTRNVRQQSLIDDSVVERVRSILSDVRKRSDDAVIEYTEKFDGVKLTLETMRVTEAAVAGISQKCEDALQQAARNIRAYHEKQMRQEWRATSPDGIETGEVVRPVERAGMYVPGGTAPLLSTVLMTVIPAQVAGVKNICVATPPGRNGDINPGIRKACEVCGIDEIYKIGGAQAIGALAYGTETVPRVDVIAGPGNQYVTEAKRQVFGYVGIDLLAGPSESLIICDETANPAWVAADLVSQAEHYHSTTYIVALQGMMLDRVEAHAYALAEDAALRSALNDNCIAIHVQSREDAARVANEIAPEHLQIMTADPDELSTHIRHAGALFIGPYAPVPAGDFVIGPSHVLPTGAAARFMSGLSTDVFTKRIGVMKADAHAFSRIAAAIEAFGITEELPAHARTGTIRRDALTHSGDEK